MKTNQETETLLRDAGSLTLARVQALTEAGADVNAVDHTSGYTVLMKAAEGNPDSQVLRHLIQHGADPNATTLPYEPGLNGGFSVLHAAASNRRNPHAAAVLLEAGADPTAIDRETGHSALHYVASREAVEALIAAGTSSRQATDGLTPMHTALLGLNTDPSRDLSDVFEALAEAGLDPNAPNEEGNSALMDAVELGYGHPNNLTALLKLAGPQGLRQKNNEGQTALHLAAASNVAGDHGPHAIRALMKAGADATARDNDGATPEMASHSILDLQQRAAAGGSFSFMANETHLRRARANHDALRTARRQSRTPVSSTPAATGSAGGCGTAVVVGVLMVGLLVFTYV